MASLEADEQVVTVMQNPEGEAAKTAGWVVVMTAKGFMTHMSLDSLLRQTCTAASKRCVSLEVMVQLLILAQLLIQAQESTLA